MMQDGAFRITAEELAEFVGPAEVQPVAPHLWLLNTLTGETTVERRGDYGNVPQGWVLLMTGPDPAWVDQWAGDLQRACDEQLNPLLAEAFPMEGVAE
ncbi:hypothetical protein [Rhodococcus tibetensis]|uniref:Uncharacterized protein n=1 Tax=Rhodococcus tibetensis TaxID=2965064 RepID=A0ABT1QCC1_9NOCA|nr:hypothetical protein [Rhodococcus sp. FXJ9.536]MCQ4119900.1 hypothetical protein [Rhodococcus sp. FXJ9.536]